jgi:citrate synthase
MLSNASNPSSLSSNSDSAVIDYLNQQRGKIISNTGGWFPGKGVFSHGYSMLEELVGEKSYFQILILNATGKLVSKELADWVEAIYGCLSWPDPRIWCNQIGALAGAARTSVVAATTLGSLAADSRSYGPYTLLDGLRFIQDARVQNLAGANAEEIVRRITAANRGKPYIVGYIRPIAKGDERLEAMERYAKKLGFTIGPHLILAYDIEKVLLREFDEGMNINGYMSAFLSDQGFTPEEVYQMFAVMVASGVTACYLDTYRRPPDTFLPLQCDDIDYQGPAPRSVPEPG